MSGGSDEGLLFGRFSREECGLPPVNHGVPRRRILVARAVVLLALLVAAGWVGGTAVARWRAVWMTQLPALIANATDRGERSRLLARGGMYARALPDRPEVAGSLALAVAGAADGAPRRVGYYANARNLLRKTAESFADNFYFQFSAAAVHGELGDYAEAFAALERADAALTAMSVKDEDAQRSLRLPLVNAQAYFLAVAPEAEGRNPEKALHLAQLMLSSKDRLPDGSHPSDSAAFVDTLAATWHAAGDAERALKIQTLALGLADAAVLDDCLSHFDTYASAVNRKKEK